MLTLVALGRKYLAGVVLSVLLSFSLAMAIDAEPAAMWFKTYGGSYNDGADSVVVTSDGGYAIAGTIESAADYWLVKTDAFGNMVWNQRYGGTGADRAFSLIATSDGGYALAGEATSFGQGNQFLLVKTNDYGAVPEASIVLLPFLAIATFCILVGKKKLRFSSG